MALRALVPYYASIAPTAVSGEILTEYRVYLFDENTPVGRYADLTTIFNVTDTGGQIKAKFQNTILSWAAANSYGGLLASDIWLPQYVKG